MFRIERLIHDGYHSGGSLLYDGDDRVIAIFPRDPEAARHVAELLNADETAGMARTNGTEKMEVQCQQR